MTHVSIHSVILFLIPIHVQTIVGKVHEEKSKYLSSEYDTKPVLPDESNWHEFLSYLKDFLSTYEVQRNRSHYNVRDVEDWGIPNRPQGLVIGQNNFKAFIEKHPGYDHLLENKNITSEHFTSLNDIICLNLQTPTETECYETKMVIKGAFIRLSEINFKKCKNVAQLDVLATDKFFFDENKTFTNLVEFHLCSNIWVVNSKVTLDLSGKTYKSNRILQESATYEIPEGKSGKPGASGTNGANFFGYANNIVNGENLTINMNGGDGAEGQQGYAAFSEIAPFDVPTNESFWRILGPKRIRNTGYPYRSIGLTDKDVEKLKRCSKPKVTRKEFVLYPRQCCKEDGKGGRGLSVHNYYILILKLLELFLFSFL